MEGDSSNRHTTRCSDNRCTSHRWRDSRELCLHQRQQCNVLRCTSCTLKTVPLSMIDDGVGTPNDYPLLCRTTTRRRTSCTQTCLDLSRRNQSGNRGTRRRERGRTSLSGITCAHRRHCTLLPLNTSPEYYRPSNFLAKDRFADAIRRGKILSLHSQTHRTPAELMCQLGSKTSSHMHRTYSHSPRKRIVQRGNPDTSLCARFVRMYPLRTASSRPHRRHYQEGRPL